MINSDVAKSVYTTTAGRLDYPIGFVYYKNPEDDTPQLKVTYQTIYDTPLVYGTDYTLSPDGLSIVLAVEPPVGTKLNILRDVPFTQKSDYVIGRIDPDQIERDFDTMTMREQQIEALVMENIVDFSGVEHRLDDIEAKIPAAASDTNQLADKTYVTNLDSGLQNQITVNKGTMDGHIADKNNPHAVTKTQVGLGNCDNTSDLNKPISTATQTALDGKQATISDLTTIRSGAAAGATAVQPGDNISSLVNDAGYLASESLSGLTDTNISSLADGEFLRYDADAGKWKNAASSASIGFSGITGDPYDNTNLTTALNTKADTDLSNLSSTGANIGNWSSNVTNCLTEIPQDIKLEYSNDRFTLKAGSKLYVPNGFEQDGTTPKFDVLTIENDISILVPASILPAGTYNLVITSDGSQLKLKSKTGSGTTTPTSSTWAYYNTTDNKIYDINGGTNDGTLAFPLCLFAVTNDHVNYRNKVFNGFGYIGSTAFVLPGVKGLIPNGRNTDGTLKSTEISITSVKTLTPVSSLTMDVAIVLENDAIAYNGDYGYDKRTNYCLDSGTPRSCVFVGACSLTNSVISGFRTNEVFHAVDYNDTEYIAHQAMPGDKYIDLTLGATGSTYTAPADGYFTWQVNTTDVNQFFGMVNTTAGRVQSFQWVPINGGGCHGFIPARKGDICSVSYTASSVIFFRFVYAAGCYIF